MPLSRINIAILITIFCTALFVHAALINIETVRLRQTIAAITPCNVTLPDVIQPAPVVNVYPAPNEGER